MRISDWSSDVCSSDLGVADGALDASPSLLGVGVDAGVAAVEDVVDAEIDAQPIERTVTRLPGEIDVMGDVAVAGVFGIIHFLELDRGEHAPATNRVDLGQLEPGIRRHMPRRQRAEIGAGILVLDMYVGVAEATADAAALGRHLD